VNRASTILRWTALAALLFTALLRAQSTRARLPYWDLDPTRVQVPETALLYSHGFLLDALVWLAAALTIVGESLVGRRIHWRSGLLMLIGAVGVALHGYYLPPPGATPGGPLKGDFMGLALGSAWAAAMVGGWTILHLARDEHMRRAAALALFSFVSILVAKGAYQVYVEHAYTVSAYKKDPAGMLAAQGLTEGSTAAKEYERRLFQAEPIGWFGLSNVYATFVAASFVFFLGLSIAAWKLVKQKTITSGPAGALSLAAIASLFGLYLTGSKGGWGAMLAGGVVLLIGSLSHRALTMGEVAGRLEPTVEGSLSLWERMSRLCVTGEGSGPTPSTSHSPLSRLSFRLPSNAQCLLPIALCLLTLAAVTVRGLIGERLAELSLLFRWHYLVAATRIFASESLFGVGPAGFKNAYALHKVPINPEMVESPHSVFFDWAATLGAFGLCWCFVLIWLLLRIGMSLTPRPRTQDSRRTRPHAHDDARASSWRSVLPVIAATTFASLVAWLRESPIVTPDEWPLRLIALVVCIAFILIGTRIAVLAPRLFTISLAAAASVVAVHSMIEMTPTQPGSCVPAMLLLGCGASAVMSGVVQHKKSRMFASVLLPQPPLVACLAIVLVTYPFVRERREKMLEVAASRARVLGQIDALLPRSADPEVRRNLENTFKQQNFNKPGKWEVADPGSFEAWAKDVRADLISGIARRLNYVSSAELSAEHLHPGRAPVVPAIPLTLRFHFMALSAAKLSHESKVIQVSLEVSGVIYQQGLSASVLASAANYYEAASVELGEQRFRQDALQTWRRVTQLDPYSLTPALSAYRLARELGQTETARDMAALALRNNDYLRLDPLKQLDQAQRTELYDFLWSESPNHTQTPPSEPDNPPPPT